MFTENLEPETVMPFLEPLMTRLVQMLQTPKRGVKVRVWLLSWRWWDWCDYRLSHIVKNSDLFVARTNNLIAVSLTFPWMKLKPSGA